MASSYGIARTNYFAVVDRVKGDLFLTHERQLKLTHRHSALTHPVGAICYASF